LFCEIVFVDADGGATTKVATSCGENPLVRVDGLAFTGDENHIRGLFIVVEPVRVGVSNGSTSEEARFFISLSKCGLVADGDAVERHGVRCSRFGANRCGAGSERGGGRKRKLELRRASGKIKL
jgi:hypothetical protein